MCICESFIHESRITLLLDPWNCTASTSGFQSTFHLLLLLVQKFSWRVSTVTAVSRITYTTLFELSSGNELADMQHSRSQSSCHPTQLHFIILFIMAPSLVNQRSLNNTELSHLSRFLIFRTGFRFKFQDLRCPFSVFHSCLSLWRLGSHQRYLTLWISHCGHYFLFCL